jgi:hypothetical protein
VDSEANLLSRLETLVRTERLHLEIDRRKMAHLDFPLASEIDGNIFVYPSLAISALIGWTMGMAAAAAAVAASFLCYQTLGKRFIERRLRRRILDRGLTELTLWRSLWRFGGVILSTPDGQMSCQGPQESWSQFVSRLTDGEAEKSLNEDRVG